MSFQNQSTTRDDWQPRTRTGWMVKNNQITSIYEIFEQNLPIDDVEIVNILVPNLEERVIDVRRVQKQTDAGEITRFVATCAVGNGNGLIGLGEARARAVGSAIRLAMAKARLNLIPVRRGCGSWECTCGTPHSLPFKVSGKTGSVRVEMFPAPKGLGLVIGDVAKEVLQLAGISDVWSRTFGDTRTTHNFAKATYEALRQTYKIVPPHEWK